MSTEPNLDWTAVVAERKIKEAMDAGEFDELPGRGQPVNLEEDPLTPPEQRVANRILKNSRALPEWIQFENDIRREVAGIDSTRERGLRAVRFARNAPTRERAAERLRSDYREQLSLVNTLVLKYNMNAPMAAQRPFRLYKVAQELAALEEAIRAAADGGGSPAP